jgi:NADH-quinone oxidoreductase subunit A
MREFGTLTLMSGDTSNFSNYIGLVELIVVAALLCGGMVIMSWILGPKNVTPYKAAPYECGVEPSGDSHERFPIKFYLIAILFILFDIEIVFLWGWMATYASRENTETMQFMYMEFLTYMSTWVLGYVYALHVGAVDWDETVALHPAKLGEEPLDKEAA